MIETRFLLHHMVINSSVTRLHGSPPGQHAPPDQEVSGLVQPFLHALFPPEHHPALLCQVQQVWQAAPLPTLQIQQGVKKTPPKGTLPTPLRFKFLGLPPASSLRFFHLEILANEEAIGSGSNAKVVNVVTPRTTLTHFNTSQSRS